MPTKCGRSSKWAQCCSSCLTGTTVMTPTRWLWFYNDKELDDDFCIGYIPRCYNETIASFLEMGWNDAFECRISKIIEDTHPENQIHLTVKIKRNKK